MHKLIWLSHPVGLDDPRPPAIPQPTLAPLYTIESDGANVQTLVIASHTGTHVDSPLHVDQAGMPITDFSPEEFIFNSPAVIDLRLADEEVVTSQHLQPHAREMEAADIVFFRFGVGEIRRADHDRFSRRLPGFGVERAEWLHSNFDSLRAIGMDVPSLSCIARLEDTMAAHNALLGGVGNRFLVVEDMDLEQDLTNLVEVRISPWLVSGMDSGPCSVVGVLSNRL